MVRGPPNRSRREAFVDLALDYADDDSHGYSQQRYDSAMQNNAVIQAVRDEGNATRQMYQQDKIDSLQQKIQTLEMQNAMAGVVRYPMSTAYNAGFNPFCNCGQNYGCCGMAA